MKIIIKEQNKNVFNNEQDLFLLQEGFFDELRKTFADSEFSKQLQQVYKQAKATTKQPKQTKQFVDIVKVLKPLGPSGLPLQLTYNYLFMLDEKGQPVLKINPQDKTLVISKLEKLKTLTNEHLRKTKVSVPSALQENNDYFIIFENWRIFKSLLNEQQTKEERDKLIAQLVQSNKKDDSIERLKGFLNVYRDIYDKTPPEQRQGKISPNQIQGFVASTFGNANQKIKTFNDRTITTNDPSLDKALKTSFSQIFKTDDEDTSDVPTQPTQKKIVQPTKQAEKEKSVPSLQIVQKMYTTEIPEFIAKSKSDNNKSGMLLGNILLYACQIASKALTTKEKLKESDIKQYEIVFNTMIQQINTLQIASSDDTQQQTDKTQQATSTPVGSIPTAT